MTSCARSSPSTPMRSTSGSRRLGAPPPPRCTGPQRSAPGPPALAGGELCGKPEGMLAVRKES